MVLKVTNYTSNINNTNIIIILGVFRKLQQHSKLSQYKQSVDKSFNNVLNVTSASFNALLQVFGTSNVSPSRQKAIMTEMEQAGLKWDSFTYTAVIMASSTSRDDVISTWSEMIKSGIVPTAAAASEMFKACMASKNGTVALEVLNWLWNNTSPIVDEGYAWTGTNIDVRRKEDSLVPDLYMCSKVLAALSQEGKTAECLILLDKMREKDIKPSTYCYMIVLNALEKSSDWKKAVNLILQMQLRGMQNQYHHLHHHHHHHHYHYHYHHHYHHHRPHHRHYYYY